MTKIKKLEFTNYYLAENKYFLAERIGDILSALQSLTQNAEGMGTRQIVDNSMRIVNQLRGILHSNWSKKEEKHLKNIQKAAVALAKSIEEKDDLKEVLPAIEAELQKISVKLGQPVNSIGSDENPTPQEPEGVADSQDAPPEQTPEPPQESGPPQQQQAPQPDQGSPSPPV